MKFPILNAYNPYLKNGNANEAFTRAEKVTQQKKSSPVKQTDTNDAVKQDRLSSINVEKVITKQERKFFVKMFPESTAQIENHVLFNRNGRINTKGTLGTMVDGKI